MTPAYWVDIGFCVEAENQEDAENQVRNDLAANDRLARWAQLTALSNYEIRQVEKAKD